MNESTVIHRYLESVKDSIARNLIENPSVSWNADEVIERLNGIIGFLSPIRLHKEETHKYLSNLLDENQKINPSKIPHSNILFIQVWLFKVLDQDSTFVYAYNYICNKYYQEEGFPISPRDPEECLAKLTLGKRVAKSKEEIEIQKKLRVEITPDSKSKFRNLFRDPCNADKFVKRLKVNGFIDEKEEWIGLSGNLTELLAAYTVIHDFPLAILKPGKTLTQVKTFYDRFGLTYGKDQYISVGSLRINPVPEDIQEFKRILSDFT